MNKRLRKQLAAAKKVSLAGLGGKDNSVGGDGSITFISKNTQNDNDQQQQQQSFSIQYTSSKLEPRTLIQCMILFEQNMGDLYRQSAWGLDIAEKRQELVHPDARFLLLYTTNDEKTNKFAGFVHFRLDVNVDDGPTEAVVYVMDIQIEAAYRGMGLGQYCMSLMERVAVRVGLPKVMLTVFHHNKAAAAFYAKLGYTPDPVSPSQCSGDDDDEEAADDEILSKQVAA